MSLASFSVRVFTLGVYSVHTFRLSFFQCFTLSAHTHLSVSFIPVFDRSVFIAHMLLQTRLHQVTVR